MLNLGSIEMIQLVVDLNSRELVQLAVDLRSGELVQFVVYMRSIVEVLGSRLIYQDNLGDLKGELKGM